SVKGLDILIEACSILGSRGVKWRLYLVGDGPERSRLQQDLARRGLTDRCKFVGLVGQENLRWWYRAADLFVLPSRSEGVPNVLREAQACGLPFVASDVGGMGEIARVGVDHLVPPEKAEALADAMETQLGHQRGAVPCPAAASWDES